MLRVSKVFMSEGVGVYVFSDDHCRPHVHARHRGEGWVARIGFSYLTSDVTLLSIAPLKTVPFHRIVNRLLDDVQTRLAACRRSWWETRQTTCLTNQWAIIEPSGTIEISGPDRAQAKQIAAAVYDPDPELLKFIFQDGTVTQMETKIG